MKPSLQPWHFEALYQKRPDPWDCAKDPRSAERYEITLNALPRARYRRGFEVGCSVGQFTAQLAGRCDSLLAVDVVEAALKAAKLRCQDLPRVRFQRMQVPTQMPSEAFDLIVLAEVGYYWSTRDLTQAVDRLTGRLDPRGHLMVVHETTFLPDLPLTGDEVHDAFRARIGSGLKHVRGDRYERFRLDLFERT